MPKDIPATVQPDPWTETATPTEENPIPVVPTPAPTKMWFGGSLVITPSNREAIHTAIDTLFTSTRATYLMEVQPEGEMLIALNDPMIALLKASAIDSTVPRYFASDWIPERNLSSDRPQDTFTFSGLLKPFKGDAINLTETHRKIAENLWLVTVG